VARTGAEGRVGVVGSLFTAGIYPVTMILWQRDQSGCTDAMLSLYVTLGILMLIAVRNPFLACCNFSLLQESH
jgi:hypothetical protein